jgi:beta-lactamase class A
MRQRICSLRGRSRSVQSAPGAAVSIEWSSACAAATQSSRARVRARAAVSCFLLVVIAAATALVLPVGSAAALVPPRTPAGQQLGWLIGRLNGSSVPSTVDLERHFSPEFLKAVPPTRLLEALAPIWSGRPLRLTAVLARDGQLGLKVRLETRSGAGFRVTIAASSTSPHRIDGLLFEPVAAPLTSWRQVDAALRRLGEHASLYAGFADGPPLHALAGNATGAIGSAFKLYVLGALARQVKEGRAGWQEPLAIRDAWKSLPSGAMRAEPAGARFSLRHYAEQMISVSDNTAADHLIGRLGRATVEAELTALGNHSPASSEPFLTTRELFALKLSAPPTLRDAFARANPARRRQLLGRVDALNPAISAAAGWTTPRAIDRIEWFASPADLAHAIATLVGQARQPRLRPLRSILAINPGIQLNHTAWPYVAFKGGSEPGVISLTWYLQRHDGRSVVLSIVINDTHREIDTTATVALAQAAVGLLALG